MIILLVTLASLLMVFTVYSEILKILLMIVIMA